MFSSKIVYFLLFILVSTSSFAQPGHRADIHPDSTKNTLWKDLDKGYFEFHKRSFAMSTINQGRLSDFYTFTAGAGIGYYSPSIKGFHIGFSGFFMFQLYQHNLDIVDPYSGKRSRYENQLYDMNDKTNKSDLDRLEELYLTYEFKDLKVELGRQKFESPLLNENDNRMRPNIFSGLSVKYDKKHLKLYAAWFNSITIRGTVEWYDWSESYGVYGQGANPMNDSLSYHGNISSLGMGVLGMEYEKKNWKNQIWNYTNENVFNIIFAQSDYKWERNKFNVLFGAQGFYQNTLNNGGNSNQSVTYRLRGEETFAYGGRIGINRKSSTFSFNYFGISDKGRYLFPREWGREKFYASLTRELFEGYGDLNAYVLKYKYKPKGKAYFFSIGAGYIDQPSSENIFLNKYSLDSYYHFTGKFDYKFKGYLEGLDIKFIAAYKQSTDSDNILDRYKINWVDVLNLNLVIDYRF